MSELREALRNGRPPPSLAPRPQGPPSVDQAAWRFLHAWRSAGRFESDQAVLLRDVARWGTRHVGAAPAESEVLLSRAGTGVTAAGLLRYEPFRPAWLGGAPAGEAVDPLPVPRRGREEVPGERYLEALGYTAWQSQAQKEAAWNSLSAPPGSCSLAALPTGSGKSLCFQLLSRFGTGLTLVVVPTVALALDHWRNAAQRFRNVPGINPLYFAADGPDGMGQQVVADVRAGRTRLVFTSPEACVSGRLRSAVEDVAHDGRLDNLVIDEAHVIESWGAFFRVDFQVLAARQKLWLAASGGRMRTHLFSATVTPECRGMLRGLFGTNGEWREQVSQRLRPEPAYHVHCFPDARSRRAAVLECAWRLPRPAILYTTTVADARELAAMLAGEGFARTGCFTGETGSAERSSLLAGWRADDIDLMVATSAFGLGVDKADVRTVVHACLPENLHRYYQEVGRSGRDGFSSVCLLLAATPDEHTARTMPPTLIGEELADERWAALWARRSTADGQDGIAYSLPEDARRAGLLGQRTYGENVAWNKRLVLLMQRAGLLRLVDSERPAGEAAERLIVRFAQDFNPNGGGLGARLAPHRNQELAAALQGLDQMLAYVHGGGSLCRTLARLYGEGTERCCGGCPGCRARGRQPDTCAPLPVGVPAAGPPARVVVRGAPHPGRSGQAFVRLARQIAARGGAPRFVCPLAYHGRVHDLLLQALGDPPPVPYRADTPGAFAAGGDETLIVLHPDELHPVLLHERRGGTVVHLVSDGVPVLDASGRYPFESTGAPMRHSPEAWLQEAPTRVH